MALHPPSPPDSREAQPPGDHSTNIRFRSPRSSPMSTSKKTRGLLGLEGLAWGEGCDILTCSRVWKRSQSTWWPPGAENLRHLSRRRPGSGADESLPAYGSRAAAQLPAPLPRGVSLNLSRCAFVSVFSVLRFSYISHSLTLQPPLFLFSSLAFHRFSYHRGVEELWRQSSPF